MRNALLPAAVLAILTVLAGCWLTTGVAGAQIDGAVTVIVEPRSASAVLGEHLDLAVQVTNNGSEPTPPLVIHLDITDPDNAGSVDPEDWTSTLTKPLGVLEAGQSRTVDWRIQPISGGSFATYAVALAPGVAELAGSNVVTVEVADRRSLNPDGILPVAIAVPALIGALLLAQTSLGRRRRHHGPART